VLDLPLDASSAAPWIKEPVNLSHDHPIIATIQAASEAAIGLNPDVTISPFVCDANFWFPLGQDCLIWGIGDPSWGIHGTNEKLPVADLINGTKAFAAATMAWCGVA
jgi:acetylornithine deacetylase/succinyl-diaminopimelate desuccinylase-like protein